MAQQSVALVVGASRGLGLALAQEWLGRGWRVIATVRGHSEDLERLSMGYPDSLEIARTSISTRPRRSGHCVRG
jgi:NAD(P)-dependent dehydrogenase (short-subunit alcohol dehydrogenase family)